jgi:hypothetical protein
MGNLEPENLNLSDYALKRGGTLNPLIIDSNNTGGTGLCNPSILKVGNDVMVNVRHVGYTLHHSIGAKFYKDEGGKYQSRWGPLSYLHPEDDHTLRTDNYLGKFKDGGLIDYKKVDMSQCDTTPLWNFVGLEDARLALWDDNFYLTGVRRDTTANGVGRMELSKIKDFKNKPSEIDRIRIEHPTDESAYCEKNWMPVEDNPYHFIQNSNPTELVKVDPSNGHCEVEFVSKKYYGIDGDMRGGSQAIAWGTEGKHLAFVHDTNWWYFYDRGDANKDAIYNHRMILWDRDWNIERVTTPFKFMAGQIEFCTGAAISNDKLLVTFGFEDNAAYLLEMPTNIVDDIFKKFEDKFEKPNYDRYPYFRYHKADHGKLKLKFKDSHKIQRNFSQVYQDLFVLTMLDGKKNGTYLEIGSAEPFYNNNTILLEKEFGWTGTSIEYVQELADQFHKYRKNEIMCEDALDVDYEKVLKLDNKLSIADKLKDFPKVHALYLKGRQDRKDSLVSQTDKYGLDLEIMEVEEYPKGTPTIDGNVLQTNILYEKALGTTCNHLKMIEKWLNDTDDRYGFFCEDDISFETAKYWDFTWSEFVKTLPNDWKAIQLVWIGKTEDHEINMKRMELEDFGAIGYMVTREYAQSLISSFKVGKNEFNFNVPEEKLNFNTLSLPEDFIFYSDTDLYTYPLFVENVTIGSTFGPPEDNFHKSNHISSNDIVMNNWKKLDEKRKLQVDYLQIDCDPPEVSYEVLQKMPFDKVKFAVITFEHDNYVGGHDIQSKSRALLESKGYKLVVGNIAPNNISEFEDWWVHPDLVDPDILKKMCVNDNGVVNAEEYILNEK